MSYQEDDDYIKELKSKIKEYESLIVYQAKIEMKLKELIMDTIKNINEKDLILNGDKLKKSLSELIGD